MGIRACALASARMKGTWGGPSGRCVLPRVPESSFQQTLTSNGSVHVLAWPVVGNQVGLDVTGVEAIQHPIPRLVLVWDVSNFAVGRVMADQAAAHGRLERAEIAHRRIKRIADGWVTGSGAFVVSWARELAARDWGGEVGGAVASFFAWYGY